MPDRAAYDAAFEKERANEYPALDRVEAETGFAFSRGRMEAMARVLACPVKVNAPCWQHGRLIYALGRKYLAAHNSPQFWVDIGTAKGFSSLCMLWAMNDAGRDGRIHSVDVINPDARVARNSVADLDGLKTIWELVGPFLPMPRVPHIEFHGSYAEVWLSKVAQRINLAFLDGKHTFSAVKCESEMVAAMQKPGDIIIFDDLQIEPVAKAVKQLRGYAVEEIEALPTRRYAVAVKE